jgi:5-methylcytosine-specific restriction endonuclease McrA
MGEKGIGTVRETYEEFVTRRIDKIMFGYTHTMMAQDRTALNNIRSHSYKSEKQRLWICQSGICYWCKRQCKFQGNGGTKEEFTVDHIISLNVGGTNHWRNLVGSCHQCNNRRGCEWSRNYQRIELVKPTERIAWSDWMDVTPIYEYN